MTDPPVIARSHTGDRPATGRGAGSPVIEAAGLTKRFGKVRALDGLDLVAPSGQVVALLGPNGAGKTTFVRAVATLLRSDEGTLHVAGVDVVRNPKEVRRLIGLAGQYAAVEEAMTGRENLVMIARLLGHGRRTAHRHAITVLEQMQLTEAADRLARTYSGGMRRRLDLGVSLVGAPRLLLLDEPTAGLDPRSRIELWDAIGALVRAGTDVLLTTQYLDEADHLADQIVIVDRGTVVAQGTPTELKGLAGRDVIEVQAPDPRELPRLAGVLETLGTGRARIDAGARSVAVPAGAGASVVIEAIRAFDRQRVNVGNIALRRPTLNEVFLALTGNGDGHPTEEVSR